MKTQTCNCNTTATSTLLERPRYYPRQLVTPDVLTLGQDYLRNMQRLHNRMLHGYGVVCGLVVCPVLAADARSVEPWKVLVRPGYALAPSGDGILVDSDRIVDLREGANCADPCAEPSDDPWCSPQYVKPEEGIYYIAIRYTERQVRPERVQPAGCGCDDQRCESSRLKDGYEIGVLCDCPHPNATPPEPDFAELLTCENMGCPECSTSPWVGLARVEVDRNGVVVLVDNCACRRLVVSFANFWWKCACGTLELKPPAEPVAIEPGRSGEVTIAVASGTVDPKARISVSRDVTVENVQFVGATLVLRLKVAERAAIGPRTVVVVNPDCTMTTVGGAVTVAPVL
jgi:hypothetical protein